MVQTRNPGKGGGFRWLCHAASSSGCAGLRYKATVGYFPDGTLGEIFLSNTKPSSQSDVNARDAAVAASLTLQFGCPLETLRHVLLRDPRGNASSPLGQALDQLGDKP
jgi:hypothetical protein